MDLPHDAQQADCKPTKIVLNIHQLDPNAESSHIITLFDFCVCW